MIYIATCYVTAAALGACLLLLNWELPRYATFLAQHADAAAQPFQDLLTEKNTDALAIMESDVAFMRALHQGEIIGAQAAEFSAWQTQRAHFEAMARRQWRASPSVMSIASHKPAR